MTSKTTYPLNPAITNPIAKCSLLMQQESQRAYGTAVSGVEHHLK